MHFLSGKLCSWTLETMRVGIRMTTLEFSACHLVGIWYLTVHVIVMSQFPHLEKRLIILFVSEYYY